MSSPSGNFTARRKFPDPWVEVIEGQDKGEAGAHQCSLGILPQLILLCALRNIFAWFEVHPGLPANGYCRAIPSHLIPSPWLPGSNIPPTPPSVSMDPTPDTVFSYTWVNAQLGIRLWRVGPDAHAFRFIDQEGKSTNPPSSLQIFDVYTNTPVASFDQILASANPLVGRLEHSMYLVPSGASIYIMDYETNLFIVTRIPEGDPPPTFHRIQWSSDMAYREHE
ncbi:hypothetical protein H0H93_002340 [Arthromyces matolae]|nr:hypothetical protein H0H93_002340 [Arthromyces matolae]